MLKFVVKIFLFILPVACMGSLLELALRKVPNDYAFKKTYLDAHSNEVEILVLGTSHNFYGVDPVYFSSHTFNAAYLSQPLNYDYEILKKYSNRFDHLKTVVLNVSAFSLYSTLTTSHWIKNYVLYYDMGNTAHSLSDHFEILADRLFISCRKFFRYYIKKEQPIRTSALGWGTNYKTPGAVDLNISGKKEAKRHTENIASEKVRNVFEANKLVVSNIISWAKEKNIRLIFVTTPGYKTYRENLNRAQTDTTIATISRLIAGNGHCNYLNLLDDTRFSAPDFFDGDHLDEAGAKKLSLLLDKKIGEMNRVPNE